MDQQQPASSRSSFSDYQSAVQGPTPLFDVQLRYLSDSYLSFFQERKRIEEAYVESLKRLHRKIRSVDSQLDDRGDLSTVRSAWQEIVENVERESQARQAFLGTLSTDVINPLTALKDTQERTRKRIKEDIKESTAAYTEYAEAVLPKLKYRYAKKFSEVEDQKRANAPLPPTSPPPAADGASYMNHPKYNNGGPSRPSVAGPQPLRALDRRPSGSGPSARNRSPSSGTAFSDLAHHGKKQFNQIIGGLLDKRGAPDGLGSRENQALRTVRAKREADEADKDYRKGIHWLETLRLRRTKILEGGYKSLEMFVEESAIVVKRALERYSDNLTATYTTQTQLSSHVRTFVDRISPEKDLLKVKSNIPRSLASAIPDPILYEHGQVGSCNDLIFGFSLVDYSTSKGLQDGEIPKIVKICIDSIDQRGLESEGIYRVSGRHAVIHALQHDLEKDEMDFEFTPKDDVYAIASLLKLYLRELPEPVFKFALQDRMHHTEERVEHQANNFVLLRSKIRRLPAVHQATLKAIIEHLARVVAHSEKNKMDPKNLAIVFGGVIFGEDDMPKAGDLLSVQTWKDTLMEDLIVNASRIFDEPTVHHSPPLPPTPATDPVPLYYGSKNTMVANMPPNPVNQPDAAGSPQDFTPRLPPRPTSSIHPSSRTYSNTSPRKEQRTADTLYQPPPPPPPPLLATDSQPGGISAPPSPTAVNSNLDLATITIPSREASSGSDRSVDNPPKTPSVQQHKMVPFPVTATPEPGSPVKPSQAQPGSEGNDPFI
ncbi:hypothetical protein D9611_003445 [Ephemerocybe angulata]|uniref:Rho-GAP domain-containing protein n=1 Tax=Ephemerocybe angulata TaxID=980116 RepID=A0A8H5C8Z4_9AGAR|nr:hypothetical protein D9611_003445 [Tulosesus angulatus]